jgi:hypothetical protein
MGSFGRGGKGRRGEERAKRSETINRRGWDERTTEAKRKEV